MTTKNKTIAALAVAAAAVGVLLGGCGSSHAATAKPAPSASTSAPADPLAAVAGPCQLYDGGSAADASPNVAITITAVDKPVTGYLRNVTVGGQSAADGSTISQTLTVGKFLHIPAGQSQRLTLDIGAGSPLGGIAADSDCWILAHNT
jgi:hypothetical protein